MNHEAEQQSKQCQTTCLSGPLVAYGGLQGSKLGCIISDIFHTTTIRSFSNLFWSCQGYDEAVFMSLPVILLNKWLGVHNQGVEKTSNEKHPTFITLGMNPTTFVEKLDNTPI